MCSYFINLIIQKNVIDISVEIAKIVSLYKLLAWIIYQTKLNVGIYMFVCVCVCVIVYDTYKIPSGGIIFNSQWLLIFPDKRYFIW